MHTRLIRTAIQRLLCKRPLFLFSQEPPTMPKTLRATEQLNFTELIYLERELMYCNNQSKLIDYLEKYRLHINDEHVAQLFQNIVDFQIHLDEEFNQKAAPILAHYISLMNKENGRCFGIALKNLAFLELRSPEIWKAVLQVYQKDRMVNYIPMHDLVEAFVFFEKWEMPPYKLLQSMAPMIKKQRFRISPQFADLASEAYEKVINNKIDDKSFLSLGEGYSALLDK